MCSCIHTYIHTYIYICTYTEQEKCHTRLIYLQVRHFYIRIIVHTYVHTYIITYLLTHTYLYIHTLKHTYSYIQILTGFPSSINDKETKLNTKKALDTLYVKAIKKALDEFLVTFKGNHWVFIIYSCTHVKYVCMYVCMYTSIYVRM